MANTIDISGAPYWDTFDKDKNYAQVLFKPDRPLQNRELNEVQSILRNQLANVGNAIFKDGDRQDGATIQFTAVKEDNNYHYSGTITKGSIYLNGTIRTIEETPFDFTGIGRSHIIGVKLVQTIVTPADDPDLLDPTTSETTAYAEGADRLKETVSLTFDDPSAASLYTFDGIDLKVQSPDNTMSQINKVLAERTYDESGSYKVNGFTGWTQVMTSNVDEVDADGTVTRTRTPADSLALVIDSGKAYILGYQVYKPTGLRTYIDKALSTQAVTNEASYYDSTTKKQELANGGVKSVDTVTAQVRVTNENVNRGTTLNGADFLQHTSVVKVESVSAGGTTYVEGTDFQLLNGQAISWAPQYGAEPATGTTYQVTYIYSKTMIRGTDYKITTTGELDDTVYYVDFNGMTGDTPVDQTIIYVTYTMYLARIDLVIMDSEGNVSIKAGQPDIVRNVSPPNHLDPYTLRLFTVFLYPNSNTTIVNDVSVQRLSMEDLGKMKTRLEDVEYNQAVNYLDQSAMDQENPIYLRGVFSDGFISLDKYDTTNPDATIAFSFEDAEITLPSEETNTVVPQMLEGQSEAYVWGRLVTAPFTETASIVQPLATEALNVNPYNVYNKLGVLKLTPSADNWIDQDRITITEQATTTITARRWWNHLGESWATSDAYKLSQITFDKGTSSNGAITSGATGSILSSGGTKTIETMIEFMRQQTVTISASNLSPNANNLMLYFNGINASITPATGYRMGGTAGSGMANADGTFKGTFTVPLNIRCGTVEVTLQNDMNLASSSYTAQGTLKTTEDIIIRTRVTVNLYDPLAESFQYSQNQVMTSVGLYFASKSQTDNCIVQIRGIDEGGQPNKTIYGERVLTPADVKVSADASAETKVSFDDPLMMTAGTEYCFVIITDSADYTMWIATMGQRTVDTGAIVAAQPYVQGVLYSSSNASAWTAEQTKDLKFNVYTATFNDTAVLEFDTMQNLGVDRVVLMATYLTPDNTGCVWDMKIVLESEADNVTVADKEWLPLSNYADLDVEQIAREVKLRATFEANRYMSPMLSLEDIMFAGFLTALEGSYVARTIDLTDAPYNTLKVQYDQFCPSGTTVTPKWSPDGGTTWKTFTTSASVTDIGNGFQTLKFNETVAVGTATYNSFKIRLDLKTQNAYKRPRVQRLLCTMKDE